MADYNPLPAPQFSYTRQLEEYDALLKKRRSKQKWGTIFNNIDAMTNANHVASGKFAKNEKRLAGSYGTSLAQESKRLSLLGKAEKEGIHQEISLRLQKATKDYSMSSKSDFDAWFETLGPHFAGQYKTYFDIWKAGVGEERAYEDQLMQDVTFKQGNIKFEQDQADRDAKKVKAEDVAFKDSEIAKLVNQYVNEYANYNNQLEMGMVSGRTSLTRLRTKIAQDIAAQDWSDVVKNAVRTGAWAALNLSVTGGASVPGTAKALGVDAAFTKQRKESDTLLQRTANRDATKFYRNFLEKNTPDKINSLQAYIDAHRELSRELGKIEYAGTYATKESTNEQKAKFEQYYKGYHAQWAKVYDPEKFPTTKAVVDWEGNLRLRTNKQIKALDGTDKEYKPINKEAAAKISAPGTAFFAMAVKMMAEGGDPQVLADLNVILNKGWIGGLNERQIKLANEVQAKLEKLNQESLDEIFARFGGVRNVGDTSQNATITGPGGLVEGTPEYEAARDLAIATLKDRGLSEKDGLKELKEAGWK